jgi:glutathione S-transferase
MKLFHMPGACSQAPFITINELGLKCDIVIVGADKTELLKYNPRGQVPTLVLDNGQVLAEGSAIMQYLADQKPEMNIIPKAGTWERYKTVEALNYVASELHKSIGILFVKDMTPETRTFLTTNVEKKLAHLNTFLGANQFMAANQYTVADAYCFVVTAWTKYVGIDMSQFPNILGYSERLSTRPAIFETVKTDTASQTK